MIELKDKVVLVTGGGGGIGAAIVRTVVKTGGFAVLHDIRPDGAAGELQRELGADMCKLVLGDLADDRAPPRIWSEAVGWKQRVDVLVNNAGIYESADIGDPFAAWSTSWHRTLQVNLVAAGHFCREALNHFRATGGGIIINLAS